MNLVLMKTDLIELQKTKNLPDKNDLSWPKQMLSRLLTEISFDDHNNGSVFAETQHDVVEFNVSVNTQKFLTKDSSFKTVAKYNSYQLNKFVTFINRDLFKLQPSSMCCGILRVKFIDEDHERLFTVYSRRSGKFGVFFQIDQFGSHL